MIIANPIYDKVFKRLMENDKVVKFFIGTLLNQNIVSVKLNPQEFTYIKELDTEDPKVQKYITRKLKERLLINLLRLDFIATVKTETGEYKKILIEIQKAQNKIDLIRFRNYLAEQYKRQDIVENQKTVLPITTIYILGFNLPEIETACLKVERNYIDLINKTTIHERNDFIEKLSHDSYIVQVDRITNRYQTSLDKLLSVFEQSNFIDDSKIVKVFKHETDLEEMKIITDILHQSGIDPEERQQLEIEKEAWRTIYFMMGDMEETLAEKEKVIVEKDKKLADVENELADIENLLLEKENTIAKNENTIAKNENTIAKNENTIAEKDSKLAEIENVLTEKDSKLAEIENVLTEKDSKLAEIERQNQELLRQLEELKSKQFKN